MSTSPEVQAHKTIRHLKGLVISNNVCENEQNLSVTKKVLANIKSSLWHDNAKDNNTDADETQVTTVTRLFLKNIRIIKNLKNIFSFEYLKQNLL